MRAIDEIRTRDFLLTKEGPYHLATTAFREVGVPSAEPLLSDPPTQRL